MGILNSDIEEQLEKLPEEIERAKIEWLTSKFEREKVDALIQNEHKLRTPDLTATDLKALVAIDGKHEKAVRKEILSDAHYERVYEELMVKKKLADLRTAF